MKTAEEWFQEGLRDIGLSRSADYQSEYRDDLKRALGCFDQALALEPRHVGALGEKAQAHAALGDHESAADAFVAARQLAPGDVELQLGAATALQRLGHEEAALGAYEAVLAQRPDDAEALFQRAELLTALRRDELAISAWDAVLLHGDTRSITPSGGRSVRVLTGDFRRSQAWVARALAMGRLERPEAYTEFLGAYRLVGRELGGMSTPKAFTEALASVPVAREAYRAYLASVGSDVMAWHRAAEAWRAAGQLDEALGAWETVLSRTPENSRAWFGKAELHVRRGELDQAIADFERSLSVEPGFLGAQARLKVVRAEAEAKRRP